MSISREDLDAGLVDLDLSGGRMPPCSPGEILRTEFLEPLTMTPDRLAAEIDVPLNRITAILAGERAITADTALRLGRYFGTSGAYWLHMQADYDLEIAEDEVGDQIAQRVKVRQIA